mmetsp:Transcript_5104/g.15752  ORF Transcript_5104/g.15752 Transcript_5104/m.15752 type:complete len:157 (-) Transcript_5104:160-630(-)
MSAAAEAVDCAFVQVWWFELSVAICFLLGFALLRRRRSEDAKLLAGQPKAGPEAPRAPWAAGGPMDEARCLELLDGGAAGPGGMDEVAAVARAQLPLTPRLSVALMRAYMAAGRRDEARAVYDEATAAGVELDDEADDLYDAILAAALPPAPTLPP